ncbi:helix-turn-helix transcriptional regulator [Acidiphilium acidophilum]|uniref:helix-turn-helix domain-containing protein n=1 Tax=Acidiphilium acidophilum TaxID=76588 RepID=UPI002E8E6C09|nr:helix-turn-helix transcriptional regulator [Acidiphilium acidophilum]
MIIISFCLRFTYAIYNTVLCNRQQLSATENTMTTKNNEIYNSLFTFSEESRLRLREAMKAAGWNQAETGRRLGYSQPTISNMLSGRACIPPRVLHQLEASAAIVGALHFDGRGHGIHARDRDINAEEKLVESIKSIVESDSEYNPGP